MLYQSSPKIMHMIHVFVVKYQPILPICFRAFKHIACIPMRQTWSTNKIKTKQKKSQESSICYDTSRTRQEQQNVSHILVDILYKWTHEICLLLLLQGQVYVDMLILIWERSWICGTVRSGFYFFLFSIPHFPLPGFELYSFAGLPGRWAERSPGPWHRRFLKPVSINM